MNWKLLSLGKQQHFIKNRQLQGVYIPTRK